MQAKLFVRYSMMTGFEVSGKNLKKLGEIIGRRVINNKR